MGPELYVGRLILCPLGGELMPCIVRDVRKRVKVEIYSPNGKTTRWVAKETLVEHNVSSSGLPREGD